MRLVRELNDVTRFVLLGLGRPGNLAGAEAALTWQSGYMQGVDYRLRGGQGRRWTTWRRPTTCSQRARPTQSLWWARRGLRVFPLTRRLDWVRSLSS